MTLQPRRRRITRREARNAARTKITVDRILGRNTPRWVRDLAEGKR